MPGSCQETGRTFTEDYKKAPGRKSRADKREDKDRNLDKKYETELPEAKKRKKTG